MARAGLALLIVAGASLPLAAAGTVAQGDIAGAAKAPKAPLPPITVSYGPSALETAQVYESRTGNSPIAILVHAGGWTSGSNQDFGIPQLATYLQSEKITVWAIDYDLASSTMPAFPTQPDEVVLATQTAIADGSLYHGNPKRVSLIGGSAGGTLVSLAASALEASRIKLRSVTVLSGPADFPSYVTWLGQNPTAAYVVDGAVSDALGCYEISLCTNAEEVPWSPTDHAVKGPLWLFVDSTDDALVPMSQPEAQVAALQAVGATVTTDYSSIDGHAFDLETPATDAMIFNAVRAH